MTALALATTSLMPGRGVEGKGGAEGREERKRTLSEGDWGI